MEDSLKSRNWLARELVPPIMAVCGTLSTCPDADRSTQLIRAHGDLLAWEELDDTVRMVALPRPNRVDGD